jgi:hypothetical protein
MDVARIRANIQRSGLMAFVRILAKIHMSAQNIPPAYKTACATTALMTASVSTDISSHRKRKNASVIIGVLGK